MRSSIRQRRVILLRSDIRLTTSDILYASFLANRISLKPQALISLSHKRQYHSAFAEYHYFYLTDKSKFEGDLMHLGGIFLPVGEKVFTKSGEGDKMGSGRKRGGSL